MNHFYNKQTTLNLGGQIVSLARPLVMGILNVTPDSFYDGGQHVVETAIVGRVKQMIAEGVDIIDVGAYSSRPGADDVTVAEEISRLGVALSAIAKCGGGVPVSVDTFRSEVADCVLGKYAVAIVNDISGGAMDSAMYDVVAKHKVAYVMMHMKGTPQTMTNHIDYDNMMADMLLYFSEKVKLLKSKGLKDIIIDPGFGFAKDLDQNYDLMANMHLLSALELPMLVGVSRKSMIYKLLGVEPSESLNGTTALNMSALMQGASILRVHDVKAAVECVAVFNRVESFKV